MIDREADGSDSLEVKDFGPPEAVKKKADSHHLDHRVSCYYIR